MRYSSELLFRTTLKLKDFSISLILDIPKGSWNNTYFTFFVTKKKKIHTVQYAFYVYPFGTKLLFYFVNGLH